MAKWILKKNAGDVNLLVKGLNISPTLARILINRDLKTVEEAREFLNPDILLAEPVTNMSGVSEAYSIIKQCVDKNVKIIVYGDYDADGVMSTVIMLKTLRELGADVSYYIPDRENEGYGLNLAAVNHLHSNGCGLLICCDNGIASIAEVERAKVLGMKVIIIDHHEQGIKIPEADAVIDPKQSSCPYKFKSMCAAGIVYRFVTGLYEYFKIVNRNDDEYISFAAIATFCDIVDLRSENRAIAKKGLEVINKGVTNLGLKALIKERSLSGVEIGAFEIGFIIGPCINATGRLENASLAVELFSTENTEYAAGLAEKLSVMNEERKKMTAAAFEAAFESYQNAGKNSNVIIIYNGEIHESIAGIVAGRIKDKLHRPTIVLTDSAYEGIVKGSARSIEGYNMFESLLKCSDLLERFGGHIMAAGMSLKKENIVSLNERLNAECNLTPDDFIEKIKIDKQLELTDATYTLAKELCCLSPFGKGNREPVFGTKGVIVEAIQIYAEKNTIRFTFKIPGTYRRLTGICFGKLEEFQQMIYDNYDKYNSQKILSGILRTVELKLDIIYYIELNEYNNNVSVNLRIKDFRIGE